MQIRLNDNLESKWTKIRKKVKQSEEVKGRVSRGDEG